MEWEDEAVISSMRGSSKKNIYAVVGGTLVRITR